MDRLLPFFDVLRRHYACESLTIFAFWHFLKVDGVELHTVGPDDLVCFFDLIDGFEGSVPGGVVEGALPVQVDP